MSTPFEQDIILDTDGQPIFSALDQVRRQVERINQQVKEISKNAGAGVANMGTMLETQTRELQDRLGQIRALAQGKNAPGYAIQDTTFRQKLGKMTTAATEYGRGLEAAGTAVEAFQTRLNRLNDSIAERGRLGRGETLTQTRQRKQWEDQKRAVVDLDNALERLQKRAGRTTVGASDRPAAIAASQRVADARAALFTATRNPSRQSFLPEIGRLQDALGGLDTFYTELRKKQADRLVDERNAARAIERIETQSLNNRQTQTDKMWAARDAAENRASMSAEKRRRDEDKAWATQQHNGKELLKAEAEKAKYLADTSDLLDKNRNKRLALTEAEKLGVSEVERMNNGGLSMSQRAEVNRKQSRAELDLMKEKAVQHAKEVRSLAAVDVARSRSITKLRELRVALTQSQDPRDVAYLERMIKQEQAYAAALRQRRTELARANATAATGPSAAQGRPSPIQAIASPGYLGAAAMRTGVYGAAAMGVYAGFDTVRGGFQYVTELEDGLAKLQAIANATNGQMVTLKASILDVAASSRFSTTELVKISQNLAQAGVSASQMTDALDSVVNLANASGSTPDEAVNLVTAALGAFQLQASEAARVADLMVTALNRTRLTVAQAGAAIQYVGATAYEQNITLDELLATASAMAQAGIKSGSTIGTGLRQFLVDLQSPSKKLQEQFDSLNLTTEQLDVTTRGLPAVLETLSTSGFGAAQAYEGLETRAAAAYLVLKNNTGLIDELRMQMTEVGNAAEANATAMDSLSAQWQRFKNIVGEKFENENIQYFHDLKEAIKAVSDFLDRDGSLMKQQLGWDLGPAVESVRDFEKGIMNASVYLNDAIGFEFFDESAARARMAADSVDQFKASQNDLETSMATLNEKIETQAGQVAELEKEYQRLLVQEDSLRDNHDRLDAETASLTNRFVELGGYLDDTKTQYESLTGAVWGYIQATQQALAGDLAVQGQNLANKQLNSSRDRRAALNRIMGMDLSQLSEKERGQLKQLRNAQDLTPTQYRYIMQQLASAGQRKGVLGTGLGDALSDLTNAMRDVSATISQRNLNQRQQDSLAGSRTRQGQELEKLLEGIEAGTTRARGLSGSARATAVADLQKQVAQAYAILDFKPKEQFKNYFESQRAEVGSLEQMLKALITPTASERREQEKNQRQSDRDARRAEREAQSPPVKRQDIIDIAKSMFGDSVRVGSGYRTQAEQDSLFNRGKTGARVSDHTTGIGQDFPTGNVTDEQGRRMAAALKARLAAEGIEAQVIYESGVGSRNGTGKHIHVGVKAGTRYSKGKGPGVQDNIVEAEKYLMKLAKAEQSLDEGRLKQLIEDAKNATTSQTFMAAVKAAEEAKNEVADDIRQIAASELASQGLGNLDPEYQARMLQVEEEIRQLNVDFNTSVAEAIMDNVEAAFKAAEKITADLVYEYDKRIQLAQARVNGFGYASMQGRIPEYVQQLAQRSVGTAEEDRDRQRLSLLPSEIGAKSAAISEAEKLLALLPQESGEYAKQALAVEELKRQLEALKTEKESLVAALGAAQTVPTTITEGLNQAIAAYEQYHVLNRSLKEEIIFNMGGAIEQAHESVNGFFSDILTGSRSVLGAFGNMIMGMMRYLQQLAAQFVANQIFKQILNLVGSSVGAPSAGSSVNVGHTSASNFAYRGGKNTGGSHNTIQRFIRGGKNQRGARAYDSALAMIAKDEWVINSSAAASVGDEFMSDLNKRGAMALRDLNTGNPSQVFQMPQQTTNVYVVSPEERPSLGENDVLVIMNENLVNGEGRRLVKSISQGA